MPSPRIHLVFIAFNRLSYTRRTLSRLLSDLSEAFELTIWDNGSTDGTREFLRSYPFDSRIRDIVFSKENVGQTTALNEVWSGSTADLLGKVDNDCLVTPGWTKILAKAHEDIPALGVIACWHFFADDFNEQRARRKIQRFGEHRILVHPWTCGSGILVKRDVFSKLGPMKGGATTSYWIRMALHGYVNGFYYPLVLQEHMDDPKSKHSHLKDEESYQRAKAVTYSLKLHGQQTLQDRWRWRKEVLDVLHEGPVDPRLYIGWRKRLRYLKTKAVEALRLLKS